MNIDVIAKIYTDFNDKFGLPRQSGLVEGLKGKIIFEKEYRRTEAVKELEGFSHIWLLWYADKAIRQNDSKGDTTWPTTVRPPRLGGNRHVGVFASRSPFRPNSIAMSVVKLDRIDISCEDAPVIYVSGIDLLNETPIIDIKPYIRASDCITDAKSGYADITAKEHTEVFAEEDILSSINSEDRQTILDLLKEDPTPRYIEDEKRIFGFEYKNYEIRFSKSGKIITLVSINTK